MSFGLGNGISFESKPAPGGGGGVTGANNGLSLSGTIAQLGAAFPGAPLLGSQYIDLNGNNFSIADSSNNAGLTLGPFVQNLGDGVDNFFLGQFLHNTRLDLNSVPHFGIESVNYEWYIGEKTTFNNPFIQANTTLGYPLMELYTGDNGGNNVNVQMNADVSPFMRQFVTNSLGDQSIIDLLDTRLEYKAGNGVQNTFLYLDPANNAYYMGDYNASNNGLIIGLEDNSGQIFFANTANNAAIVMNGTAGFSGTVSPVTSITVDGGIVTNVT